MASRDPFSSIPDIAAYLPRPATERALGLLANALEAGDRAVLLEGPPGIGKTLLLHLLAERLRGAMRPVAVPIPTLSPDELWHWVVGSLGSGTIADTRQDALGALGRIASSGPPVLLLIDDANSLPPETVRALGAALAAHKPALRALLVATDDEETGAELLLALGTPLARIRFEEAMTPDECAAYVRERLARADVDAASRARFDDVMLARLHAHSQGVPAAVHELADVLLRPDEAARAHELAAELRPDIVASAAARRARESIERVAEWGDEDLAMAVAGRSKAPAATSAEPDSPPPILQPVPDSAAEVARSRPAEEVAAGQPPAPLASVPRPRVPAAASGGASSAIMAPIALAAALAVALVAAAVWYFDLLGPPPPTHTATFIEDRPKSSLPSGAPPRPAEVATREAPTSASEVDRILDGVAPASTAEAALTDERSAAGALADRPDALAVDSDPVTPASAPAATASTASAPTATAVEASSAPSLGAGPGLPADGDAVAILDAASASNSGAALVRDAESAQVPAPAVPPAPKATPAVAPEARSAVAPKATPAVAPEATPAVAPERAAAREPAPKPRPARKRAPRPPPALAGQLPPSAIAVTQRAQATYLATVIAPAGTRIEIDDDVRGTAPLAAVLLSEGDHRVRWVGPDGAAVERVFRVDAEHRTLDLVGASRRGSR